MTSRLIVVLSSLVALAVCAIVHDRITAAGARGYVSAFRAAERGAASAPPSLEEVMSPAIDRAWRLGLLSGGAVLLGGAGAVAAMRGRRPRA